MLMIIMHHCFGNSGGATTLNQNCPLVNYYGVRLIWPFLNVHVNCFVLISGYFLCKKNFKLSKVFTLWGSILFWSVSLEVISLLAGYRPGIREIIETVFPLSNSRYWFITTYILMYIMCPFINLAIEAMNKMQHLLCILTFFGVYILLQNVVFWSEFSYIDARDPGLFIFLYMVGAYFRKYPMKKHNWLVGYLIACSINAIWTELCAIFSDWIPVKSVSTIFSSSD